MFNRFARVAHFNPIKPNSEVNGHHGHQAKSRSKCQYVLNRLRRYGDVGYDAEELVAELGSAFICADLNLALETPEENAAPIASCRRDFRSGHMSPHKHAAGHDIEDRIRTARLAPHLCTTLPSGGRRAGTNSVPAGPCLSPDDRAIPRLQAAVSRCSQ
jgi:hypothetical protein